jgi:hypothetical protein
MLPSSIIELDAYIIVYGLALIVALKLLNSSINMRGLLIDKSHPSRVSPARVQLLIATISLSAQYVHAASTSLDGSFPKLGSGWLYLFGGSSAIYVVRKAFERRTINKRLRQGQ